MCAQVMQDTNTAGWDYSAEPCTPKGHSLPGQSSIRSQVGQPRSSDRTLWLTLPGASVMSLALVFQDVRICKTRLACHATFNSRCKDTYLQYCQRGIELDASKPLLGLAVACVGGVCFGLMTPLMFIATSALPTTSHWRVLPYG